MRTNLSLIILAIAMFFAGCNKYDDDINNLEDRLDALEGSSINSIEEQMTKIEASIETLKTVDTELNGLIDALENTVSNQQTPNADVAALQTKVTALESKISALESYVDSQSASKDWAETTFATLAQYAELQTELAQIKALVDGTGPSVGGTGSDTTFLKQAIAASETSMKEWVNTTLADGYYDIAAIDAKLSMLVADSTFNKQMEEQKTALEQAKTDLTAAYTKAIEDAVANEGVIDKAIASAVTAAKNDLQSKIDTINTRLTAFESRIQSLTYIPTHDDRKATMKVATYYSEAELTFFVTPKSAISNIKLDHLSAKGIYTASTRSVDLVDLPVTAFSGDAQQGTLTVTLSGENLSDAFFNATTKASVFLMINDGNSECVSAPVELVPVSVPNMGDISDPALVKKGDFAMKDGSFLAGTTTLTEEQKANVAGIVFWTMKDAETVADGRGTPASLADDKILTADFPNCNHGLIVALKDVSTSTVWISYTLNYSVYEKFQNTESFSATNKEDYVSISTTSDEPTSTINYIYGYQHTKLLKAFNEYNTSNNYEVQPVNALTSFSTDNPAPRNTTGWFLPSLKELSMLYYKDVDDIYNEIMTEYGADGDIIKNETMQAMNTAFEQLGTTYATKLSSKYWSTNEYNGRGWNIQFSDGQISENQKKSQRFAVRAVCAF